MSEINRLLRARKRRKQQSDSTSLRRIGASLALLASLVAVLLGLGGTIFYTTVAAELPSVKMLPLMLDSSEGMLLQPTRFYDHGGEHVILELENPAVEERNFLRHPNEVTERQASLPPALIEATIAVADPTFWDHPGFTTEHLLEPEEHITLAQRLVANLLLWDEPATRRRALRERILAAQITSRYGREKVLAWYLNSAYYGNQIYGVDAAAQVYFDKSAADLSLAEAAILVGVAEAPSINPHDAPDEAISRGRTIIETLRDQDKVSTEQADEALEAKITFREAIPPEEPIAGAFANLVWEQIETHIPIKRLERGGFEIITTLDYDLQVQAACATEAHLARLKGDEAPSTGDSSCQAARLLPTLQLDGDDSFENLNANVIILDPHTGEVRAFINESPREVVPAHPAGTTISPFLYLTAFTRGFHPASLLWDIPSLAPEAIHPITNPEGEFQGPLRLRIALANDALIPALATMRQIGADNVWRTMEQFGITPSTAQPDEIMLPDCPRCQYLLEGNAVSLLELAQAYGALANQGFFVGDITDLGGELQLETRTIGQIRDTSGRAWLEEQPYDKQGLTSMQLAYLMTHILSDESARWQSLGHPNPLEIGRPAAAKMGQTADGNDVWTMGYTPQLVVGVWTGRPAEEALEGGRLPPKTASALWHAVIQYASRELPAEGWEAPLGINTMAVCDPSGMLPTESCPSVVTEVFLSGHEPTQVDTLYRSYEINRETGRLATVFTPPELIEEEVFMLVPAEASAWAQEKGISTPPEAYDVISAPDPSPQAQITSPAMFSTHKGEITIRGSATGDDFHSYRLQVGEGLNPESWLAISEEVAVPVESGILARWDASERNGLYALQLIVVRTDQQIDTHTVQMTVDNQSPEITILYPEEGQALSIPTNPTITFQVQAHDNLGVEQLTYFIDDEEISTQNQPPFALSWQARPGEHTLQVEAVDLAGNTSTTAVTFSVE